MSKPLLRQQPSHAETYEQVTRRIRWMVLAVVLFTVPLHEPQTLTIVALTLIGALFNLTRYGNIFMQSRWYSSRLTMLVADNLLVAVLLQTVGRIDLPYSALFGFIIITATYWYGIRGMLGTIAGQVALLAATSMFRLFPPLVTDPVRVFILAGGLLVTFGLLLEQLTRVERQQRDKLEQLEREQQAFDSRLMALINSLGDAVTTVDAKGNIAVANTALNELSKTDKDLRGTPLSEIMQLKHAFKDDLDWDEAFRDAPVRYRDYFLRDSKGNQINLELTITPISRHQTANLGYIVSFHDITQDKSLDQQRQEFIAVASHELRTPLSIIEGALSLALSPGSGVDDKIRAFLEQAHRNARFLAGLIEDLTLLTKAQNDNIEIQPTVVDPSALLNQLVNDYTPQAAEKHLALRLEVKEGTPTVLTTERYVEQIMRNLTSNAIKYTATGEVVLRAEPAENNSVLLSVQDAGKGISQADQKHLFTKFFRSENFQTRETGGTGLGLYICQEIAERINAKIWVKSKLDHGSTFFLEVPPFSRLKEDQGKVVTAGVTNLLDQL